MSAAELGLRRAATGARADAWLIPGGDPSVWLAVIGELGLAASEVRAYPLPRSRRDPRAAGLLIVHPEAAGRSARALPMRRIGTGLHLPAEAELVPPAYEGELERLLAGRIGVLLPDLLVAFTASDALTHLDLVEAPPRRATRWDGAVAGLAAASRLVAIDVERPSLEVLLTEGGGEVGTKPLKELPPAPGEPARKGAWRAWLRRAIAGPVLRWAARAPTTASAPTWVDKLEKFATELLSQDVLDERQRQLARLLALLDSDPEQGLLYALPLAGSGGRGVAPPGGKLTRRRPDYDPAGHGGNKPVDAWDLDPHVRWELHRRYRLLANRELELGRFRRAAYVFAELLGDLRSAAQALASGRHYLEAAELFRDRLGDRQAAAHCLEQGGLLVEALSEWRALGRLERVAELLTRLGRDEEACAVHRERVRHRLAARDRLGAATILEEDLRSPDEALALLARAWPDDPHLESCLRSYFALLARHAKHEEARRFMAERRGSLPRSGVREPWLRVLAHLAASPGEPELQASAADAARVLVGRALAFSPEEGGTLLAVLGQSAPRDPLLRRDTTRHAVELQAERRRSTRARPGPRKARLEPAGEFRVDLGDPELCTLASTSELLLVFTNDRTARRPRLDAYAWRDGRSVATWNWEHEPALLARGLLQVVPLETKTRVLAVPSASQRRLELVEREVGAAGRLEAGTPDWMPPRVRAICPGARGDFWIAHESEAELLVLSRFDSSGVQLGTLAMAFTEDALLESDDPRELPRQRWDRSSPVFLVDAVESVFVASRPQLWRVDGLWNVQQTSMPAERLLAAPPCARAGLVVVIELGCYFLRPDRLGRPDFGICLGPTTCCDFLRGGLFAQVCRSELAIASIGPEGARAVLRERLPDPGAPIIALVPAERPDELALIAADGLVRRLRVLQAGE